MSSNVINITTKRDTDMGNISKQSKAYIRWRARILDISTPWTENDIIYFRKAIGGAGLKDTTERDDLRKLFEVTCDKLGGFRITTEQSERGRDYLLSKSLKLNGDRRLGCRLDNREIAVLKDLDHHLFVGLYSQPIGGGFASGCYLPVYRAVSRDGGTFEYVGATYDLVQVVA
jgi:hypothetical protein